MVQYLLPVRLILIKVPFLFSPFIIAAHPARECDMGGASFLVHNMAPGVYGFKRSNSTHARLLVASRCPPAVSFSSQNAGVWGVRVRVTVSRVNRNKSARCEVLLESRILIDERAWQVNPDLDLT